MAEALAGNFVRAEDILDTIEASTQTDTSIVTAAANFTITLQEARIRAGTCTIRIGVTTTNALTATAGNIADVTCATLDSAYRPLLQQSFATYGAVGVTGAVQTSGAIRLNNADTTVPAGGNIEFGITYLIA